MNRRIWEIAVVCLFCILEVGAASFFTPSGKTAEGTAVWQAGEEISADRETEEVRALEAWVQEGGNNEDWYFDAGSRTGAHFTAYRVPYDEVRADRGYKDGDYLAIEDMDSGNIFYVPDAYGELVDIQVTDSCVCIRDRDPEVGTLREHRIPEYFLFPEECVLNIRTRSHDTILAAGEDADELPQRVWQESFVYDTETWEVVFERISPVYNEGFWESSYGYMADYRLVVRNGEGAVVSEQRISGYPVCYEKVYWMIDLSGDGFLDIAFCTSLISGTYYHSAVTYFLIWDARKQAYEEKPLPVGVTQNRNRFTGFVYWVPELSAVWTDIDTDAYGGAVDGMFSCNDGKWELIRRLECIYSEMEIYEDPRLNEEYHAVKTYRELYYQDDELVKEKERERPWRGIGEDDVLALYPRYGWKWEETEIGGVTFYSYYVRIEE